MNIEFNIVFAQLQFALLRDDISLRAWWLYILQLTFPTCLNFDTEKLNRESRKTEQTKPQELNKQSYKNWTNKETKTEHRKQQKLNKENNKNWTGRATNIEWHNPKVRQANQKKLQCNSLFTHILNKKNINILSTIAVNILLHKFLRVFFQIGKRHCKWYKW